MSLSERSRHKRSVSAAFKTHKVQRVYTLRCRITLSPPTQSRREECLQLERLGSASCFTIGVKLNKDCEHLQRSSQTRVQLCQHRAWNQHILRVLQTQTAREIIATGVNFSPNSERQEEDRYITGENSKQRRKIQKERKTFHKNVLRVRREPLVLV